MPTEEQLSDLEQVELEVTEEVIAVMLLLLGSTKLDIKKEIRSFYQEYGKDGVVTYKEAKKWISKDNRRKRLLGLFITIHDCFNETHIQARKEFRELLTNIIALEEVMFGSKVKSEKILGSLWGVDESNWKRRLEDDIALWVNQINNDIKLAILQNRNIDEVLEQLDNRFKAIERALDRLVMTESTAVGSLARKQIFRNLGVTKYKYYARIDERTCEYCGQLHGTIFPISEFIVGVTASPIHPRCRCWEEPIFD